MAGVTIADITTQLKEHYEQPFIDAMNRDSFLYNRSKKASGKDSVGKEVQFKVHNPTGLAGAASYAEGDALPVAGKQVYTNASVAYAYNWVPVQVTGPAEAAQRGAGGYFDLLSNEMKEATEELKSVLNDQMLAQSLGTSTDINGLGHIIDDGQVDASRTSYAGITFSSNTWWKPYVSASATDRDLTLALMQDQLMNLRLPARKAKTSVILTSTKNWYDYGNLMYTIRRINDTQNLDGGYQALNFAGIPVVDVPALTAGDMYFLDENKMRYYIQENFRVDEKNVASDARYFITVHYSQLVFEELFKQGRIANLTV